MQEWPHLDVVHERLLNDGMHELVLVPLEACTSVRGRRAVAAVPSSSSSWTLLSWRHASSTVDKTDGGGAQPTGSTAKQGRQGGWRSTADKVGGGAWPMRTTSEEGRCGSWGGARRTTECDRRGPGGEARRAMRRG